MTLQSPPLQGLRVLDLSRVLAGPTCTMTLADLGAEVIKVERPGQGDDTRQWGPPFDEDGLSAYFCSCNRNKRSLTLDLKSPAGRRLLLALARVSDVVVENFLPDTLDRLGLGYDVLRQQRPDIVLCSITGFGQSGPRHQEPGYDLLIQGMSGLMSITGPSTGEPIKVGVAITDVNAGLYASTTILAALWRRASTGVGEHLDVALLDTAIASLANVGAAYLMTGQTPVRHGNAHPSIVPYQVFGCADGPLIIAVGNDRQWQSLCGALQQRAWQERDDWQTNPGRVAEREHLCAALEDLLAALPRQATMQALQEAGVPCGPVNEMPEVFGEAQLEHRNLCRPMPSTELVGFPVQLLATDPLPWLPPPALGEHSREILTNLLGLSPDQVDELRRDNVV